MAIFAPEVLLSLGEIVHWPPTNQWTAALQPYSLFV